MITNEYKAEVLESETVYQGFLKLVRYKLKHSLFGGGWSKPIIREVVERQHAVAVLMHDTKRDEIILVEQFRIGALNSNNPWVLELVAGLVEPGENPEDVARREAAEESGAVIKELKKIAHYYSSAGGSNEVTTIFCAETDTSEIGGVYGLDTENEDILVHKLSSHDFIAKLNTGEFNVASLVIAAQWFQNAIYKKH